MRTVIGVDCTFLQTAARQAKACLFDAVPKSVRFGSSTRQSAKIYSRMISLLEGKRSAAHFAVDKCIQVYVFK